jgi:hypothetical protein
MTVVIVILLVLAALIGFADGMVRLLAAMIELVTKIIAIYFDR